jgi:alpha-mannosidase
VGGVCLDGHGLVFSACQPVADGRAILLRCFNTTESAVTGSWRLGAAPSLADVVRADGTVREEIPLRPGSLVVPIALAPRAVHTVKLTFDD